VRLLYLDEAGFCGSPPVQRSWSPRSLPHEIEPNHHCRRSVIGALDFGSNTLIHAAHTGTVKGPDVVRFIDSVLATSDGRPTVIVLDNASIHHAVDELTRHRWLTEHKALLFYLPAYSPELNMIEIVWRHLKYRWRNFLTWTKQNMDAELAELLRGYGSVFKTNFL
jgi:transposase